MTDLQQRLEDAVAKLDVLGTTDAVGMEMVARGIKASPGCAWACVLAEYFGQEFGVGRVSIGPEFGIGSSLRWHCGVFDASDFATVVLPPHVGRLASEFDSGMWPQLEKGEADD